MTRTLRASSIIWKTVVSAGAMLGAACAKAPPPASPATTEAPPPASPEPAPPPAPAPAAVAEAPAPPPEPEPEPPPAPPATITVEVMSKPAGADVYLDDELVGKTPLRLEVPQGATEMNLKVMRKGYVDKVVAFTPEEDRSLDVVLEKPAKRPRGLGTVGSGKGSGSGKGVGRGFILS